MRKSNQGITLVEIMLVLSILAVFATLSIPPFTRFVQTSRLSGQANQMLGQLRAARRAAIMKNIHTVFTLDTANHRYFYFEDENGDGNWNSTEYRSAVIDLPPGIILQAHTFSQPAIFFEPKGNATESGTIVMQNIRNHQRTISVFGGTGNASVR